MKKTSRIDNSFGQVLPIIILFSLYTLFQGWVPHWGIVILSSLLVGVFIYLFSPTNSFFSKPYFIYFVLFVVFIFCNILAGDDYWSKHSFFDIASVLLMMLVSIMSLYYFMNDYRFMKEEGKLVRMAFFIIIVSSVATAILNITTPQIIRFAMMSEDEDRLLLQLYKTGMSNYYLPHAIPTIIPALVLFLKNDFSKRKKIGVISILIACIALVYFSGAMAALLLLLFALFGSLVISKERNNLRVIIIAFFLLSPFVFSQELLLNSLEKIRSLLDEENFFYSKIVDFENSIIGNTPAGDIDERSSLYESSWKGFFSNPLIGTNDKIGGHSTNLDFLASMGLIGFIPYALLLFSVYKWTSKKLAYSTIPYYSLGFFTGIIMLSIKSINNMETWFFLFVLLPIVLREASSDKIKYNPISLKR